MSRHTVLSGVAGLAAIALTASLGPATSAAEPDRAAEAVELLSAAPATRQSDALAARVRSERDRAVELDTAALGDLRVGDAATLTLFDDTVVSTVIEHRDTTGGVTSWSGRLAGEDGSFTAVRLGGVSHVNVASVEHGTFEVAQDRAGDYVVTEAGTPPGGEDVLVPDADEHADEHADEPGTARRDARGALPPAMPRDAASTVDVAIVYPPALVSQMGAGPMQAQFALGITQTNDAFRNSGIPTQLRLVGTRQVSGTQSADITTNLRALGTPGDGVFDEAQALREETHADLVSLWLAGSVPAGATCGIAYLGGLDPRVESERDAWSTVYASACATDFRVFGHEVGHNFSGNHDAGAAQPPVGGKPYARGYVDVAAGTVSMMSYYDQCNRVQVSCTRIPYYSSPAVLAAGRPQGTTSPPTNNVQAITEQVETVANYRQSQIYPGAVSIGGGVRWKGTAQAVTTPWSPAVSLTYQWFLDGAPIAGATAGTYRPARSSIGHALSVQVTGSAPYYAPVPVSTAAVAVGKATFKTRRPKLRGVPRAGRVLSVKLKGWKPRPAKKSVKVRYQWLKNQKPIKGAKKSTYRIRAKDRGKKISVRVTVKKKGYAKASRSSKKVKIRR